LLLAQVEAVWVVVAGYFVITEVTFKVTANSVIHEKIVENGIRLLQ